jgi:hypothetical protein
LRFCRNWRRIDRSIVGGLWLSHHAKMIKATGRSVEELGIQADNSQVHWSGLGAREAFHRGNAKLPHLPGAPIPRLCAWRTSLTSSRWTKLPSSSWHSPKQREVWLARYRADCAYSSWSKRGLREADAKQKWWDEVKATGQEHLWSSWRRALRKRRNLFRNQSLSCLSLRAPRVKTKGKTYWCPVEEVEGLLGTPGVGFFSGLG